MTVEPLAIEFPVSSSSEDEKARIRQAHLIDRDSQITEPSVKEFVQGMEKRRLTTTGWHSIFSVMRDGEDLAHKLQQIVEVDNPELQVDLLSRTILPYIQIVETDAVCEHTGLRLNDIWRYSPHLGDVLQERTWPFDDDSRPGRSCAEPPRHWHSEHREFGRAATQTRRMDRLGWRYRRREVHGGNETEATRTLVAVRVG